MLPAPRPPPLIIPRAGSRRGTFARPAGAYYIAAPISPRPHRQFEKRGAPCAWPRNVRNPDARPPPPPRHASRRGLDAEPCREVPGAVRRLRPDEREPQPRIGSESGAVAGPEQQLRRRLHAHPHHAVVVTACRAEREPPFATRPPRQAQLRTPEAATRQHHHRAPPRS